VLIGHPITDRRETRHKTSARLSGTLAGMKWVLDKVVHYHDAIFRPGCRCALHPHTKTDNLAPDRYNSEIM
jgi:hypothetical protein